MPTETLVEGPSRTGKSLGIGLTLAQVLEENPGTKLLIVRKTLKSMRDTVLATWEEEVLPSDHPALRSHNRHSQSPRYEFENESLAVATGCNGPDDIERIKSSEWDIIWENEATDLFVKEHETLLTRLSGKAAIGGFIIADCNPVQPMHWLNRRADTDKMRRILTTLDDNPRFVNQETGEYTDDGKRYVGILDNLTGVRYLRLRKGIWCVAEGAIWGNFDDHLHVIDAPIAPIKWHFASVDWGFRDPGVIGVWGVDAARRMYLMREIYMTEKNSDWWADKALDIQNQYDPRVFVCDPSRADMIDLLNHRLYQRQGRNCAIPAINEILTGCNVVRDRLAARPDGTFGIYFLRNALEAVDPLLDERRKPRCTVDEIPGYAFKEVKDGQANVEAPENDADNHGCDMTRYGCMYLDYALYEPEPPPSPKDKPGTLGHELGMDEMFERIERGEFSV